MERPGEKGHTSDAGDVVDMLTMFGRNVALHVASERLQSFDAIHGKTRRSIGHE